MGAQESRLVTSLEMRDTCGLRSQRSSARVGRARLACAVLSTAILYECFWNSTVSATRQSVSSLAVSVYCIVPEREKQKRSRSSRYRITIISLQNNSTLVAIRMRLKPVGYRLPHGSRAYDCDSTLLYHSSIETWLWEDYIICISQKHYFKVWSGGVSPTTFYSLF